MNTDEFNKYLNERYEKQLKWYSEKSRYNKKRYEWIQATVVIFSVASPVIINLQNTQFLQIGTISSVLVAALTGLLALFKYQENWFNYRTVAETLKKEKYYYEAKIHEYAVSQEPEKLFVDRVESIISKENTMWISYCNIPQVISKT
jgi:hypothetical protein